MFLSRGRRKRAKEAKPHSSVSPLAPAPRAHLAHATFQQLPSHLRRLPRRENHARVGNRDPQNGHELFEVCVVDGEGRRVRDVRPLRVPHPRNADRMRPGVVLPLEVRGVLDHGQDLVAVVCESEQNADALEIARRRGGKW
jgi:hypothetical protein